MASTDNGTQGVDEEEEAEIQEVEEREAEEDAERTHLSKPALAAAVAATSSKKHGHVMVVIQCEATDPNLLPLDGWNYAESRELRRHGYDQDAADDLLSRRDEGTCCVSAVVVDVQYQVVRY